MTTTRGRLLSLGVLLGMILAGRAPAQDAEDAAARKRAQSHLDIPLRALDPQQAEDFLKQRLRGAQGRAGAQKALEALENPALRKMVEEALRDPDKFGITPDQIDRMRQQLGDPARFKPDLNDPNLRKLLGDVLERQEQAGNPGQAIPPEQREALKQYLGRFPPDVRPPGPPGDGSRPPGGPLPRQMPSTGPAPPGGQEREPPGMPDERTAPPSPPPSPPDQPLDTQARLSRELLKLAEHLQQADPALQNSPALRNFVRQMSRYADPAGRPALKLPDAARHLGDRLPRLGEYLHLDRVHVDPARWQPPPGLVPRPRSNQRILPNAVGGLRAPHAAGNADGPGWQPLLWVLVGLGFALALWRTLAWRWGRRAEDRAAGWRLGPWPVRPGDVASRADLVRAFDYLALLRLGRVARAWNHREIAARLGDDARSAERRDAADRLALLYEQARYAPPSDPLPDAALAAARRHLCLLAGVPAA